MIVVVVTADFGLNGHQVLGVFREQRRPTPEQMARFDMDSRSVTGYGGLDVKEMMVE